MVAQDLLKKLLPFLNLSGRQVPWGNVERNAEVTKLMTKLKLRSATTMAQLASAAAAVVMAAAAAAAAAIAPSFVVPIMGGQLRRCF